MIRRTKEDVEDKMENVIVEISRFVILILMTVYTIYGFAVFKIKNKRKQRFYYKVQRVLLFLNHFICNLVLYMNHFNRKILIFYLAQLAFLVGFGMLYPMVYRRISRTILNHMLMLFSISFVMLARLSFDSAWRQLVMAAIAMGIGFIVPVVMRKLTFLTKLQWIYGVVGIGVLAYVFLFGVTVYGAKNWVSIGGVLIQPSEFVKLFFVFFVAAGYAKSTEFKQVVKISALAACHVFILVLEKDLGASLILFLTYLTMLYVANGKSFYLFGGLLAGSAASVAAYYLFPHVQVRVSAWRNPWSDIANSGYQVAQSLFAIGTGGWFGMGIGKGLPNSIPVGKSDFIFSAISEELGAIFAIWIIFLYAALYILFLTISLKQKELFYKLTAVGLSTIFMVQVFLCIGGVTKFIPSTGVTLPLISYGGSSVLSCVIIFSIMQGLYLMNQNEEGKNGKEKKKSKKNAKRARVPVIRESED